MPLFLAILAPLLVIGMIVAFVRNAIFLKRDIDRRVEDFRVRLESEANSTLEAFLKANSVNEDSR